MPLLRRVRPICGVLVLAALLARPARADDVVPPEVLLRTQANLPKAALPPTQDHVLLEFTISVEGTVSDIVVTESAGFAWDEAAKESLAQWKFRPALHLGQPTASRTRLAFNLPKALVAPAPAPADAGAEPEPDAGAPPLELPDAGPLPEEPSPSDAGHPEHVFEARVTGKSQPRSRGGGDFTIDVGALAVVPRATGGEFLKLAPGILLTNEGGAFHADRIFLRGFDAREGQDLELSAEGVPINESGNLHGNGYADLNFLIPETIESVRVVEGPFDPRQGNYAVAGSAEYALGVAQRGVTLKASLGSYNSQRVVATFRPQSRSSRNFFAAQLVRTDGYGQNRQAVGGAFATQFEGDLSESVALRVGAQGYLARYGTAGVLRQDDVAAGRKGFYDTYDFGQGGDALRASVFAGLHGHGGPLTWDTLAYFTYGSSRLRENFTGFLEDTQLQRETLHGQRGDLLDRSVTSASGGVRGWGRWRTTWLGRAQELEVGFFGRFDVTDGAQSRIEAATNFPYRTQVDLDAKLGDLGLYADANLGLLSWLTLRGGLRTDLFTYDVLDRCAAQDVRRPSGDTQGASCLSQQNLGAHREPYQRNGTTGTALMPRATLLLGPFAGLTFSGSFGDGVRSIDPIYVAQDLKTPFAAVRAWEGGATYGKKFEPLELSVRGVVFGTRVDKDLIFSEQQGRNVIAGATNRLGALAAGRLAGRFFDVAAHLTWVKSTFEDTGNLVPYVPDLVARLDAALFDALPWKLASSPVKWNVGLGVTFVGQRALPLSQRSDVIFTTDLNLELSWRALTVGFVATNLFNAQYRLAEFNFASDFRADGGATPTLVPARHFAAGAPRAVWLTVGFNFGGQP